MNLVSDYWNKNKNEEYHQTDISRDDAIKYLKKLDGKYYTEVLLEKSNSSLSIAGGNFGLCIINYCDDDENSYLLTNHNNEAGEIILVCGGQSAEFDLKYCFEIDFAINVLNSYFENKDILSLYDWV
jgi:hypothetical protein